MNFFLFIIALILVVVFSFIGICFMVIKSLLFWNKDLINTYWMDMAISLDQLGNVSMSGVLNVIFIKGNSHTFGNPDETISSVLGKNQKNNTLAYLGRRLVALLDWLDKDHSIKSIEKL